MSLLEVVVCSLSDAIAAQEGGAGRLEIVRSPEIGVSHLPRLWCVKS
jgi:copper homeostasis protein CutC